MAEAGSSPRVRSRLPQRIVADDLVRIISACAEQTLSCVDVPRLDEDHLRVCGADVTDLAAQFRLGGSSPRVRSRQQHRERDEHAQRIISACAEQTRTTGSARCPRRDHLRVCGADLGVAGDWSQAMGSSPRVRSRRARPQRLTKHAGIISACAEQTSATDFQHDSSKDHLRVCGADAKAHVLFGPERGSSPRVRSRRPPR